MHCLKMRGSLSRKASKFEFRNPPLLFEVDPGVVDISQEHKIRFQAFAETRLAGTSTIVLPEGSVVTDGFLIADRSNNILVDSFRAHGMISRYGFKELNDRRL